VLHVSILSIVKSLFIIQETNVLSVKSPFIESLCTSVHPDQAFIFFSQLLSSRD